MFPTDFTRVAKSALAAGLRAITIKSHPGVSFICLNISRSRRFIRFRTTALPTRRLTVRPYLVAPSPLGNALITISFAAQDRPFS